MSKAEQLIPNQKVYGTVASGATLREALSALKRGMVVVLDSDRSIVGVATQGDFAKAADNGLELDAPVASIMNDTPFCLSYDDQRVLDGSIWDDETMRAKVNIPLKDGSGKYTGVLNYLEDASKRLAMARQAKPILNDDDLDFLFVSGMPKSGTTWVANIFRGHPEVALTKTEGHLMTVCYNAFKQCQQDFNEYPVSSFFMTDAIRNEALRTASINMLHELAAKGVRVVGEKTPQVAFNLTRLASVFPEAKVVHIVRDGRDVVVSHWFNELRNLKESDPSFDMEANMQPIPDEFVESSITHWRDGNLAFLKDKSLFGSDQVYTVRYEDLHVDAPGLTREMLSFIGVSSDDEAVAQCVENGSFKKQAGGRKRGQEDVGNFYRKGIVGDHVNYLTKNQLQTIDELAGATLRQLGYTA